MIKGYKVKLLTAFLLSFILISSYAEANNSIPEWCAEEKYFELDGLHEKARNDYSFESAMIDYENDNKLLSAIKFRNYFLETGSPGAAYNTAFISEEVKSDAHYGGEYYRDLCINLESSEDFRLAYNEYKKDTNEGDRIALRVFGDLSEKGSPVASLFLSRMYFSNAAGRTNDNYDQVKSLEYALLSLSQGGSYSESRMNLFPGFAVLNFCDIDSSVVMSTHSIYEKKDSLAGFSNSCDLILDYVAEYEERYKTTCDEEEDVCSLNKAMSSGGGGLEEFCSYSKHWYEVAAKSGHKDALDRIIYIYGNREKMEFLDSKKTCLSYNREKIIEFAEVGMDHFPQESYYIWEYGIAKLERNRLGGFNNEILGTKYLREAVVLDIENGSLDSAITKFNQMKKLGLDNMFVDMSEEDISEAL